MNLKSKNSLLILALLALIILASAGYLLSKKSLEISPEITRLNSQSSSDEVDAIEKDLEETDFNDLDAELTDIEAELNASQ
ncbi:hypothetical protein HY503_00110 [Candidatus Woesebacteria bacterium]|nr:hypothetical protein [Candidatus Woesebacteria bacterium]